MPVPKKKLSASRSGRRRGHLSLKINRGVACSNCGVLISSHTVCGHCGFYRGRQLIKTPAKKNQSDHE